MNKAQFIGLAMLLLGLSGGIVYMKTRGLRNNNPGNIEDTGQPWRGLADPRNDGRFMIFLDARYGIRALARILHNYQALHGISSIRGIINRWAPPTENNTDAYVASVAQRAGVSADAHIIIDQHMLPLVAAIIRHENGIQPYSDTTLKEGISMAGVVV